VSEPSSLRKESALKIWVEKINYEGQFCVFLTAIVHRSCRDSTLLINDLTVSHEVIHDSIGYSLQKTGCIGSMPLRKSEFSNKAGADNVLDRGY